MASYFNLTLDTTGPAGVTASINGGDATTADDDVTLTIGTSDSPTTGYQMKIWGSVDTGANANIQATEGASTWIAFSTSQAVKLSTGDGTKTLNVKVRDDVYNESSSASDTITLDTTVPGVTISTAPDATKISKISGKRTSSFAFTSDSDFKAYEVRVVPATSSPHSAGTLIGSTNGSSNVSGTGAFDADTPISVQIDGRDLEVASSGDGVKIVKVFVQSASNDAWSTA